MFDFEALNGVKVLILWKIIIIIINNKQDNTLNKRIQRYDSVISLMVILKKAYLTIFASVLQDSVACKISGTFYIFHFLTPERQEIFYLIWDIMNFVQRCSMSKGVLRNFTKFTGKQLCHSLLFNKKNFI